MSVINYCGAFVPKGGDDPIDTQMNQFLKEGVTFEMPENVRSWYQKSKIQVSGHIGTKTTKRTLKMKDGSEMVLEKTEKKTFTLELE
jgi:hypothetical protein